jgi:hypothetical protein
LNTRRHVVVALRTRDAREAARRAARVGRGNGGLASDGDPRHREPAGPAPAARVEAEGAIDAEARRAIAGLSNRLGEPAFLDAFGWSEERAAEDVAEQLRFSIGGHFEAYDDAGSCAKRRRKRRTLRSGSGFEAPRSGTTRRP